MKIHCYSSITDRAWGGGNQFLKVLQKELRRTNQYAEDSRSADCILYNGYQDLWPLVRSWIGHGCSRSKQRRLYRVGPILSLHRSGLRWKIIDRLVIIAAQCCAHSVVFQSHWSYEQACARGFRAPVHSKKSSRTARHVVIGNAVDRDFFFPVPHAPAMPINLIYTSWSSNWNKGFAYLQWLDEHLDPARYHMQFIGNTPVSFRMIEVLPPMKSDALGRALQSADIFISPVKDDACSNALVEGLSCGLPAVALASGGNGELVRDGGILFHTNEEMLAAIDTVAAQHDQYRSQISVPSIERIAEAYIAAVRASIE